MPNFRGVLGHRNQVIILSGLTLASTAIDPKNIAITFGCMLGMFITPDWDLNGNAMGLIGRIGFVDEYAAIVPHRHKISHTPVVGTAIRFALTFLIPYLIIGLLGYWVSFWIVWRLFVGLCAADAVHILTDRLFTCVKKYLGRHRRRKRRHKRGYASGRRKRVS